MKIRCSIIIFILYAYLTNFCWSNCLNFENGEEDVTEVVAEAVEEEEADLNDDDVLLDCCLIDFIEVDPSEPVLSIVLALALFWTWPIQNFVIM